MSKNIGELQKYFAGLNFAQKKEFISNLKQKLETVDSAPHRRLLEECVQAYNAEVRKRNEKAGFAPKPKMPDISPDTFARALATLLYGNNTDIKTRILGKWQREPDEGNFYYIFNDDGTFETNEYEGAPEPDGILRGNFTVGLDKTVLMEPHEKLKFTALMFSQTGDSLIITLKDGMAFEYKKQLTFPTN
ncbi:MAG: hypothetical protein FWB96_07435 [Defluviitaleaceae bacterium]|nr:hypothetical protein [Defluviitaleaceae bacterium]MCL2262639.1 hypothetical protein [Defluviitaleaceae bacterium]